MKFDEWASGLTKYVVGTKANPPKKPRSPPKNGNVMPKNMVSAGQHGEETHNQ